MKTRRQTPPGVVRETEGKREISRGYGDIEVGDLLLKYRHIIVVSSDSLIFDIIFDQVFPRSINSSKSRTSNISPTFRNRMRRISWVILRIGSRRYIEKIKDLLLDRAERVGESLHDLAFFRQLEMSAR
jgi:hypothetical protein